MTSPSRVVYDDYHFNHDDHDDEVIQEDHHDNNCEDEVILEDHHDYHGAMRSS